MTNPYYENYIWLRPLSVIVYTRDPEPGTAPRAVVPDGQNAQHAITEIPGPAPKRSRTSSRNPRRNPSRLQSLALVQRHESREARRPIERVICRQRPPRANVHERVQAVRRLLREELEEGMTYPAPC
ncbi:hypothetical protein A0H81_01024 [Grifola frondosa]|uniref:Uncharacterized protein n=1 Tax=Grifola frondosa TaxID=5627 RepID=A0A1C7MP05_GRIFR|nr:hypothetical protein A0H81_03033 [Grifola frondosa]OBZ78568.1 hypothetical protein A0H81_01024 [Grifola frondosa]